MLISLINYNQNNMKNSSYAKDALEIFIKYIKLICKMHFGLLFYKI